MEVASKNIFLKTRSILPTKKIAKKTGQVAHKVSLVKVFILVVAFGTPIGVEFFLDSSFLASIFVITLVYPFLYFLYLINQKVMQCKYMP